MKLFNSDGSLTEEGMKAQREAKARGKDRSKRSRGYSRSSGKGLSIMEMM